MSRKPLILSVGGGRQQQPFLEKLSQLGFALATFDRDPLAPGFKLSDHHAIISTWEASKALAWIKTLPRKPDAVMCFSYGRALVTQQQLLRELELPGAITCQLAELSGDKAKLATRLHALGFRERAFDQTSSASQLRHQTYIVKDRWGGSSRNIRQVQGCELQKQLANIDWEHLVIEPKFEGTEYRIAAIIQNGVPKVVNRFRRESLPGTFLTARLSSEPTPNSVEEQTLLRLLEITQPGIDAPIKADMIGEHIIELDFGLSGDFLEQHLTHFGGGGDLAEAMFNLYLGLEVEELAPVRPGCTLDYIFPHQGQVFNVHQATFEARAHRLLGECKIIPIQAPGRLIGRRSTNMDALFAIIHHRPDLSHQRVSSALLSELSHEPRTA